MYTQVEAWRSSRACLHTFLAWQKSSKHASVHMSTPMLIRMYTRMFIHMPAPCLHIFLPPCLYAGRYHVFKSMSMHVYVHSSRLMPIQMADQSNRNEGTRVYTNLFACLMHRSIRMSVRMHTRMSIRTSVRMSMRIFYAHVYTHGQAHARRHHPGTAAPICTHRFS